VVSHCVPREHLPTHLGRRHHGASFACLVVILGQRLNISEKFTAPVHPLARRRFRFLKKNAKQRELYKAQH
jgi:hypothetical protein